MTDLTLQIPNGSGFYAPYSDANSDEYLPEWAKRFKCVYGADGCYGYKFVDNSGAEVDIVKYLHNSGVIRFEKYVSTDRGLFLFFSGDPGIPLEKFTMARINTEPISHTRYDMDIEKKQVGDFNFSRI